MLGRGWWRVSSEIERALNEQARGKLMAAQDWLSIAGVLVFAVAIWMVGLVRGRGRRRRRADLDRRERKSDYEEHIHGDWRHERRPNGDDSASPLEERLRRRKPPP